MWNPFNKSAYSFGYEDDNKVKKYLIIGISVLLGILLIILIILLSTGVIQLPDFFDNKDPGQKVYDTHKDVTDSKLKKYYWTSDIKNMPIAPRSYREATVDSCVNRGAYIEFNYTVETSEGPKQSSYELTAMNTFMFDCDTGTLENVSSLNAGDKITLYSNTQKEDEIPYLIIRGEGYKAIEVSMVTMTEDNGIKFISKDNSVKLIGVYGSVGMSAVHPDRPYVASSIKSGDIIIFRDDTTTSGNRKYITQDKVLTDEKPLTANGYIMETGGYSNETGLDSYAYIDYSTSKYFVLGDSNS